MAGKGSKIELKATLSLVDKMTAQLNNIEKGVANLTRGFEAAEKGTAGLREIEVSVDTGGAESAMDGLASAAADAAERAKSVGDEAAREHI